MRLVICVHCGDWIAYEDGHYYDLAGSVVCQDEENDHDANF